MQGLGFVIEDERWQELQTLSGRAFAATFEHLNLGSDFEVAVLGCDDARIAVLNQDFRGKPQATNVLSWPTYDLSAEAEGGKPDAPDTDLGNIAIAFETCAREAEEQGKTFEDHTLHLLVHGLLHLLGYDHIRDGDAALMERLETEILGKLGISDPY